MDEPRLEQFLRQYRPVGPPADLRTRVLTPPPPGRVWPWAAAAAALLAVGVALQTVTVRTLSPYVSAQAPQSQVDVLREALSDHPDAPRVAEWIVISGEWRRAADRGVYGPGEVAREY